MPCQPSWSSRTLTRGASRAAPSPPAAQRMPVPRPNRRRKPAAHRGHQRHEADGLRQGEQHAEGEEKVPGLPDQPQQDHTAPVQQAARQHEVPRPIPLAQPPADRGKERPHHVVHGHERPNGADPPAEVAVRVPQRGHHDPGRLADGAADHLDHHQNPDNDPAIMEAAREPARPQVSRCLQWTRHRAHPCSRMPICERPDTPVSLRSCLITAGGPARGIMPDALLPRRG